MSSIPSGHPMPSKSFAVPSSNKGLEKGPVTINKKDFLNGLDEALHPVLVCGNLIGLSFSFSGIGKSLHYLLGFKSSRLNKPQLSLGSPLATFTLATQSYSLLKTIAWPIDRELPKKVAQKCLSEDEKIEKTQRYIAEQQNKKNEMIQFRVGLLALTALGIFLR